MDLFQNLGTKLSNPGFTGILKANSIQISMDGKGRWMDNGTRLGNTP